MRVRVRFEDLAFVHVVEETSGTVDDLIGSISQHIQEITGGAEGQAIRELALAPDYALNLRALVKDVVKEDDQLVAVSQAAFISRQTAMCEKAACCLERQDLNSKKNASLEVGIHKHNRVFVRFSIGSSIKRLELVGEQEASGFREGEFVLFDAVHEEDTEEEEEVQQVRAAVRMVFALDGGRCHLSALLLSLQVSSDPRPELWRVPIARTRQGKLKVQAHVLEQRAIVDWLRENQENVRLPGVTVRTGEPLLPTVIPPPGPSQPYEDNNYTSAWINLSQNEEVFVQQSQWHEDREKVVANYWAEFQVINPLEKPVIISKVLADYGPMPVDGGETTWQACSGAQLAHKGSYAYYRPITGAVTIPPGASTIALGAWMSGLEGPVGDVNRITHWSLPQPLRLRFKLENSMGNVLQVFLHQVNSEVVIPDAKPEANELARVVCDENRTLSRMTITVKKEKKSYGDEEYIAVSVLKRGGVYLYYATLVTMAHDAEPGQTEIPLEDMCKKSGVFEYKVFCLLDKEKSYIYGLRIEITSPSAQVIDYVKLPPINH